MYNKVFSIPVLRCFALLAAVTVALPAGQALSRDFTDLRPPGRIRIQVIDVVADPASRGVVWRRPASSFRRARRLTRTRILGTAKLTAPDC